MEYSCYYCYTWGTFGEIIEHCVTSHSSETLKIREKLFCEQSGKIKLVTKNYSICPQDVNRSGKCIKIDKESKTLETYHNTEGPSSPKRIKSEVNTSTVQDEETVEQSKVSSNMEGDKCSNIVEEIIALLPSFTDELRKCGKLDDIVTFMRLVSEHRFPLNNIAFELFLDVVKWFSLRNTVSMRYSQHVKQFWRIGYKLFHGRFIRFMSGFKNIGSIVDGTSTRGNYNPEDSKINFVVPDLKILQQVSLVDVAKPGVINEMLDLLEPKQKDTSFKICFDGKRINSSKTTGGEIDLFGFEKEPTLETRKTCLDMNIKLITEFKQRMENISELNTSIENITEETNSVADELKALIQMLSLNLKSLREERVRKLTGLQKFKAMGGPDWKKSKYVYVISYLSSELFQIDECLGNILNTMDKFSHYCAILNGSRHLFSSSESLNLDHQENHLCLSDHYLNENTPESQFVKQRTDAWHKIRRQGKVTGSTIYDALGLSTLKKQLVHFDNVIHGIEKDDFDSTTAVKLKYGQEHEIDAMATLVGKYLPVFHPNICFVEEGCYVTNMNENPFLVVSPDGSGYDTVRQNKCFSFEFKCPYPGKEFVTQVHYRIPFYYIPQLLAEMFALSTNELIYLCYSELSSTVFRVKFSDELWQLIMDEITFVYGSDKPTRPSKRSPRIKIIKEKLVQFVESNTEFICELPSLQAIKCKSHYEKSTTNEHFFVHTRVQKTAITPTIGQVMIQLQKAEESVKQSYHLTRTRAAEVLVFMMSDLDRLYNAEIPHSLPICYGLQGHSLTCNTMRQMLDYVLSVCQNRGFHVPVYSCDGQWYSNIVKSGSGHPLTILQLQKQVWSEVKKITKSELVKKLCEINTLESSNMDKVLKLTFNTYTNEKKVNFNVIEVCRQIPIRQPKVEGRHIHLLKATSDKPNNDDNAMEEENETVVKDIMDVLPSDLRDNFDDDVSTFACAGDSIQQSDENVDVLEAGDLEVLFTQTVENPTPNQTTAQENCILDLNDVNAMLSVLQTSDNAKIKAKWIEKTSTEFKNLLRTAEAINKSFTKAELVLCLRPVMAKLKHKKMKCNISWQKWKIVNLLSDVLGDKSTITTKPRINLAPESLKKLCKTAVSKYPKHMLNVLYGEYIFPEKIEIWKQSNKIGDDMKIDFCKEPSFWYSQPEYNDALCMNVFGVIDAHHLLTNARSKCCSTGITDANINKTAWIKVARNSKSNQSMLNTALVEDLIDRQSNAFAKRTFSEQVEIEMRKNGDLNEAEFCRLIRNWYAAEDDPGISAEERTTYRLDLRQWLLSKYNYLNFPPPGLHVSGIPVVLFEGLLTSCERKIQL